MKLQLPNDTLPNFVIGVSGKAGSGKDTFIKFLFSFCQSAENRKKVLKRMVYKDSFAYPIKAAYSAMFDIPMEYLEDPSFKEEINPYTSTTHRKELQLLGTEFYRDRTGNPDVWLQLLKRRVEIANEDFDVRDVPLVFITDVRFPNEAGFANAHGLLINIERPGSGNIDNSNHKSEAGHGRDPYMVVVNDGSLADLQVKVEDFFRKEVNPRLDLNL